MRRKLIPITAALGLLCSIAAAGGASAKTTISFWQAWGTGGAYVDYLKDLVKKFNDSQKKIEVKMVFSYPIDEKLLTAIAGGTGPDVTAFDRFMLPQWGNIDAFIPLTPYIRASNMNSAQFVKATWNESTVNGAVYGIPIGMDTRVLYYNKTLFQKRGLNPNAPPKTWQDVNALALKLTKRADSGKGLESTGFIPYEEQGTAYTWFIANNVEFFNPSLTKVTINNRNAIDALNFEADLVEKQGGFDMVDKLAALPQFGKGSVGMVVNGDWFVQDLPKQAKGQDIGVSSVPYNKEKATWSGGWDLCIPKLSKHKDAAWEFIKFATSKENQLAAAKAANSVPAVRSAVQDLMKSTSIDSRWKFALNELDDSVFRPQSPISQDIWSEILNNTMPVIQRKVAPQTMLDAVVKKMQPRLDRANSRRKKN